MPDQTESTGRDNVVSMERLRERRKGPGAENASVANVERLSSAEAPAAHLRPAEPDGAGEDAREAPVPGVLTWLHCPTCGTLEYTELPVPGGRRHKCGAVVEEAEVGIDVRAELTVAELNLRRVAALEGYLQQQRARFEEYRHRLGLIAGELPEPYTLTEDRVKALPAADVDPLGLIATEALHNPAQRFKKR